MTTNSYPGRLAKTYVNTGTNATPTWNEMKRVKDVNLPLSKGEVELASRESVWKKFLGGLKEAGLSFAYRHKRGTDTIFQKLMDSYLNGTAYQFAVVDQAITVTGAYGFKAFFEVFEFEKVEELESEVIYNATLKLTEHEEAGSIVEPAEFTV